MKEHLHSTVYAIPIPTDLNAAVLAACREELRRQQSAAAPLRVVRYIPAAAAAAVCVTVLGVALYTGGPLLFDQHDTPVMDSSDSQPPMNTDGTGLTTDSKGTTQKGTSSAPTDPSPSTTTGKPTDTTTGRPTASAMSPTTTTAAVGRPTTGTTGVGNPTLDKQITLVGRFQEMTAAELETYYGQRVAPAWLPEDLETRPYPGEPLGIYHRDEGAIAKQQEIWNSLLERDVVRDKPVIRDTNRFRWQSFTDGRRELVVHLSSAPYPRYHLGDLGRFDDVRTIADTTARIAYYSDVPYSELWCYSALLTADGVEYYVTAWNLTEEEFIRVLESLIL